MGRLNEPIIHHFSHPHPLHLSTLNPQHYLTPPACPNCTLPANSGLAYTCTPCNFNLHLNCAQMPTLIQHPSHPAHQLTLLPVPANPKGYFDCKACGRQGTGFSYHCSTCSLDLHTLCASLPLTITSGSTHGHPLNLVFSPPYENKRFSCDACGGSGSDHWLYRCVPCGFDTHVECRSWQASPRTAVGQVSQSISMGKQGLSRSGSGGGKLVRQMVQGLVGVASQQIGYRLLPGYGVGRDKAAWDANAGVRGGPAGAWHGNVGSRGGGGSPSAWNANGGGGGFGGRNGQNVYGAGTSNDQIGANGDECANWN